MTRGYLDELEAQLVERTEALAVPPPLRRRQLWAIGPALAATAAIVVVVLLAVSGATTRAPRRGLAGGHAPVSHRPSAVRRHRTRSGNGRTAPASGSNPHRANPTGPMAVGGGPSRGPVPRGFGPESFTAISDTTWWLLGRAPCSSPPCTSIVRTTDGGRTFVGIPAPRTSQVFDLRFANDRDGFAYGPQLWVTHDGGADWHQVELPGSPNGLAIGDGYVYTIASVQQPPAYGKLMRSPVGGDAWTPLPVSGQLEGLWVHGHDVLLEADTATGGRLLVSHDDGARFSRYRPPPNLTCQFVETDPGIVWAPCATGMMSGVWRSTDGGASFHGVGGDATRSGVPAQPNSAAFAAASSTTAVYGGQRLFRTGDAGAHWTPVSVPVAQGWRYLGFTDATHGVALGWFGGPPRERLFYTTDGGRRYHLVTIRGVG